MKCTRLKDKLAKAIAIIMIVLAVFTLAATFMPVSAMAATSGDSCITGLCCAADRWYKCFWVPNWRFKYNPISMACC